MHKIEITFCAANETDAKRFREAVEQFARGLYLARVVRVEVPKVEEYPIWETGQTPH